jgi:transcription elongation GreA/GreB family factor
MGKKHNQKENADILVLRSRRADLEQAQSSATEDIQDGDDDQQEEGRIQYHRLTRQIQAVEDQIEEMIALLSDKTASQDDSISVGRVVTLRIDGGETKTYILVNESGGQELSGKTTLSSGTPVGHALIGRHVGEVVPVEVGEEQITIEVVKCNALA